MVAYRNIRLDDIEDFWELMNTLDEETEYMLYEPGERRKRNSILELKNNIQNVLNENDFLQVSEEDGKIIGYIWAKKGKVNRDSHTAYIVIGILKNYTGNGIGTTFFENLNEWAKAKDIIRLELTVECPNEAAIHLYKKCGFKIEGVREKSMFVNGNYVDEYYMAKIL